MLRTLTQSRFNPWRSVQAGEELAASVSTDSGVAGDGTVSFGYKQIPEEQKSEQVREVFKSVASRYDMMNDVMSVGVHRLWKNTFVDRAVPFAGMKVLDVAGGTGDIAFRMLGKLNVLDGAAGYERDQAVSSVVVSDISPDMLEEGKKRAMQYTNHDKLQWVTADAEKLPFEDGSFDLYTVAFGVRNMTHKDRALAEAFRVLRHGGRYMCLEFSQVTNPMLSTLYDAYSFAVIPTMGRLVAADSNSYQYLVESIRKFPDQKSFAEMITQAGFSQVTYENMTGGMVAIHSGVKL